MSWFGTSRSLNLFFLLGGMFHDALQKCQTIYYYIILQYYFSSPGQTALEGLRKDVSFGPTGVR